MALPGDATKANEENWSIDTEPIHEVSHTLSHHSIANMAVPFFCKHWNGFGLSGVPADVPEQLMFGFRK